MSCADDVRAPHPSGPYSEVDWSVAEDDLRPQPSRVDRVGIDGDYYVPVGVAVASRESVARQRSLGVSALSSQLLRDHDTLELYSKFGPSQYAQLHRYAGLAWTGFDTAEAAEHHDPAPSMMWELLREMLSFEHGDWFLRWLDPAQQQLLRDAPVESLLGVVTSLSSSYAEHLDLDITPDGDTLLLVLWPRHAWRLPAFTGEYIDTPSERAARVQQRRPRSSKPEPHAPLSRGF